VSSCCCCVYIYLFITILTSFNQIDEPQGEIIKKLVGGVWIKLRNASHNDNIIKEVLKDGRI